MKVLHTADWHLGKRLHEQSLSEDHVLFFDWFLKTVEERGIDVVLVSGDVFDAANPPTEARKTYFELLTKLAGLGVQVVITGGNHDSPAMLNAPKDLLSLLRITTIGRLPDDIQEALVPLGDEANPEAVVAAIPFVRDSELNQIVPGLDATEKAEAIRAGLKQVFADAALHCQKRFPGLPALAMGHLFAKGVLLSESEREIQVGNIAGVEAATFPESFNYVALGHIHQPQQVDHRIRYSGSPIALSFSERDLNHRVIELTIESGALQSIESVEIPKNRELLRLEGDPASVLQKLQILPKSDGLTTLIEARIKLQRLDPAISTSFREFIEHFNKERKDAQVVKQFIILEKEHDSAAAVLGDSDLEALQPIEVFDALLDQRDASNRDELRDAFQELLQDLMQKEEL